MPAIRRFGKIGLWTLYALVSAFVLLEGALRVFPGAMPFAHTWNYLHHYLPISRFLTQPETLGWAGDRYLAIGDSFTRGAEVPPGRDWPTLASDRLKAPVFNLGVGGASTVEELVVLQSLTLPASIDTVVLTIYRNDPDANVDDMKRLDSDGTAPFLARSNHASDVGRYESCMGAMWDWIRQGKCIYFRSYAASALLDVYRQATMGDAFQAQIADPSTYIYDPASRWYVPKAISYADYASRDRFLERNEEPVAVTMALVSVMNDHLAQQGKRLLVVYAPAASEVYAEEYGRLLGQPVRHTLTIGDLLKRHLAQMNIPYLDMTAGLRARKFSDAPLYRKYDEHFSEEGHAVAAQLIADFIARQPAPVASR